jgi:hypothetical protein
MVRKCCVVFLLCLICFLSLGQSVSAQDETSSPLVVYSYEGDIFVADVISGQVVQLTETADQEEYPSFSEDGSLLSYTRDNEFIVVAELYGESVEEIACNGLCMMSALSPSGESIAYVINTSADSCWGCGEWHIFTLETGEDTALGEYEVYGERTGIRYQWVQERFSFVYFAGGYRQRVVDERGNALVDARLQVSHPRRESEYLLTSDCVPEDPGPICGTAIVLNDGDEMFRTPEGTHSAALFVPEG